jgi:hypothetical protein
LLICLAYMSRLYVLLICLAYNVSLILAAGLVDGTLVVSDLKPESLNGLNVTGSNP